MFQKNQNTLLAYKAEWLVYFLFIKNLKSYSGPFVNEKMALLSKILAVSVDESKQVSWASQLS